MRFYNTLTRKKEKFVPLEAGKVKMYACGPTVYNFFHVGNARCFVVFDMLRRYLEYRGFDVTFVQNFTDIDDKVIRRANEEGVSYGEIAGRYIAEYFTDAKGLGIRAATVHPKATDNIDTIIGIVQTLLDKGYAYLADGDVYFRTSKFPEYGKLSHMPIEDLEAGARIDVSLHKENPLDFALWKGAKPGEPAWDSPFGPGRPGWHIECSAMVRRYLGETIDIHCGGQDLTFPHHENEIAQSECCTGHPFARFWLHNGYINIDNKKMSKSLGNFFTVREIAEEYGYLPVRHFILSAHYRSPINFSREIIEQSAAALERIFNCGADAEFYLANVKPDAYSPDEAVTCARARDAKEAFIAAMDDDFNTGSAIAAVYDIVKELNLLVKNGASADAVRQVKALFDELTNLLGFVREDAADADFIREIEAQIAARTAAKQAKDYARADAIRAALLERGVTLEDTREGTKYKIEK